MHTHTFDHMSVCANAYVHVRVVCVHVCIIMYVCMQCVRSWSVIRILSPDINSQKKAQYAGQMWTKPVNETHKQLLVSQLPPELIIKQSI